jgi:fimbrial isopeptide formation D2 family protein/LPXTG-motif cell wall-anchored protein
MGERNLLMKKLLSILLALVMILSLATTAFATDGEEETGSITISNPVDDATYKAYMMFVLESYASSEEGAAHSYKVADGWDDFVAEGGEGAALFTVDDNGYVTANDDATGSAIAEAAMKYVERKGTALDVAATLPDNGSYTVGDLALGYYFVDSSLGALCSLDTTNPSATIQEKNAAHSLDKKVKEGTSWQDENDVNVGDTVEFKATITIAGPVFDLVMHDTMDDGLTFAEVSKVMLNEGTDKATELNGAHYSVLTGDAVSDGHTFDVDFSVTFEDTLKNGDVITVYYSATLNSNAVEQTAEEAEHTAEEAELNKAHLTYKDTNNVEHETEDDITRTYTWKMSVFKFGNNDETKGLAGAKFVLYKNATTANGETTYSNPVKVTTGTAVDGVDIYKVDSASNTTEIITGESGKFEIRGLDAGTYYLVEEDAPAGYNELKEAKTVVINHDGQMNADDKNGDQKIEAGEYETEIKVNNNSGTELPETGGMGTTLIYTLGAILAVGSLILLVVKKRMAAAE